MCCIKVKALKPGYVYKPFSWSTDWQKVTDVYKTDMGEYAVVSNKEKRYLRGDYYVETNLAKIS